MKKSYCARLDLIKKSIHWLQDCQLNWINRSIQLFTVIQLFTANITFNTTFNLTSNITVNTTPCQKYRGLVLHFNIGRTRKNPNHTPTLKIPRRLRYLHYSPNKEETLCLDLFFSNCEGWYSCDQALLSSSMNNYSSLGNDCSVTWINVLLTQKSWHLIRRDHRNGQALLYQISYSEY